MASLQKTYSGDLSASIARRIGALVGSAADTAAEQRALLEGVAATTDTVKDKDGNDVPWGGLSPEESPFYRDFKLPFYKQLGLRVTDGSIFRQALRYKLTPNPMGLLGSRFHKKPFSPEMLTGQRRPLRPRSIIDPKPTSRYIMNKLAGQPFPEVSASPSLKYQRPITRGASYGPAVTPTTPMAGGSTPLQQTRKGPAVEVKDPKLGKFFRAVARSLSASISGMSEKLDSNEESLITAKEGILGTVKKLEYSSDVLETKLDAIIDALRGQNRNQVISEDNKEAARKEAIIAQENRQYEGEVIQKKGEDDLEFLLRDQADEREDETGYDMGGDGDSPDPWRDAPQMARGGIIDGPQSGYPAILHGREAVVPLDTPFTRQNYSAGTLNAPSALSSLQAKDETSAPSFEKFVPNMFNQIIESKVADIPEMKDTTEMLGKIVEFPVKASGLITFNVLAKALSGMRTLASDVSGPLSTILSNLSAFGIANSVINSLTRDISVGGAAIGRQEENKAYGQDLKHGNMMANFMPNINNLSKPEPLGEGEGTGGDGGYRGGGAGHRGNGSGHAGGGGGGGASSYCMGIGNSYDIKGLNGLTANPRFTSEQKPMRLGNPGGGKVYIWEANKDPLGKGRTPEMTADKIQYLCRSQNGGQSNTERLYFLGSATSNSTDDGGDPDYNCYNSTGYTCNVSHSSAIVMEISGSGLWELHSVTVGAGTDNSWDFSNGRPYPHRCWVYVIEGSETGGTVIHTEKFDNNNPTGFVDPCNGWWAHWRACSKNQNTQAGYIELFFEKPAVMNRGQKYTIALDWSCGGTNSTQNVGGIQYMSSGAISARALKGSNKGTCSWTGVTAFNGPHGLSNDNGTNATSGQLVHFGVRSIEIASGGGGGGGGASYVTNGLIFNVDASESSSYSGSGNTWIDIQGGNNVSLTNCSYSSSHGGGIAFDGVSQWSMGEFTTPFAANQPHTWEVWTNGEWSTGWPGSPYTWILHNNNSAQSTGSSYLTIGIDSNNYFFGALDGRFTSMADGNQTSTNSIVYHLILTWDGSTQIFYVDGNQGPSYSTGSYPGSWQNNTYNTTTTMGEAIGGNYRPLKGNIYSVRAWDRALSSSEVTTNWNGNKAKFGR